MLAFMVSLLAILAFLVAFVFLKVVPVSRKAINEARSGALAMLNNTLSDDEKEAAIRASGLSLLKGSFGIFWRITASLLMAVAPIYLVGGAGLVPPEAVATLMLRWDFILGTTLVLGLAAWAHWRFGGNRASQSAYSHADRITHKIAFAGPGIQLTAADIEERLFKNQIHSSHDQPPIFITSLPRAGTTVLLTALNEIPCTATHTYRDMPFVMAPLLWSRLSKIFAKKGGISERAHKDGIDIGFDSPEAFEEVIWRAWWPKKYHDESIELWRAEDIASDAVDFLSQHFRKIVALRTDGLGRYISKNNNNIARLEVLPEMFPGAQIVVPVRDPCEHAASLLRQHKNFLKQHATDPFIERYMKDIGHLEFGSLHTPIAFPGFDASKGLPTDPDYWLSYWIAAYRTILDRADQVHVLTLEEIDKEPERALDRLCQRIQLDTGGVDLAKHFRRIGAKANDDLFDSRMLSEAKEIYQSLRHLEV